MEKGIYVALDFSTASQALEFARRLKGSGAGMKVGKQLFTAGGPDLVRMLVDWGFRVFLDLKYHDIPNTVAGAVASAHDLGVSMVNVHCSGGPKMMTAAAGAAMLKNSAERQMLVLGVTVLTSMDQNEADAIYGPGVFNIPEQVRRMSFVAAACGLDGVVCSGQELGIVRQAVKDPRFITVVPGIREKDPKASPDDQMRVITASEAGRLSANHLVIGRPITAALDPVAAYEKFHNQFSAA